MSRSTTAAPPPQNLTPEELEGYDLLSEATAKPSNNSMQERLRLAMLNGQKNARAMAAERAAELKLLAEASAKKAVKSRTARRGSDDDDDEKEERTIIGNNNTGKPLSKHSRGGGRLKKKSRSLDDEEAEDINIDIDEKRSDDDDDEYDADFAANATREELEAEVLATKRKEKEEKKKIQKEIEQEGNTAIGDRVKKRRYPGDAKKDGETDDQHRARMELNRQRRERRAKKKKEEEEAAGKSGGDDEDEGEGDDDKKKKKKKDKNKKRKQSDDDDEEENTEEDDNEKKKKKKKMKGSGGGIPISGPSDDELKEIDPKASAKLFQDEINREQGGGILSTVSAAWKKAKGGKADGVSRNPKFIGNLADIEEKARAAEAGDDEDEGDSSSRKTARKPKKSVTIIEDDDDKPTNSSSITAELASKVTKALTAPAMNGIGSHDELGPYVAPPKPVQPLPVKPKIVPITKDMDEDAKEDTESGNKRRIKKAETETNEQKVKYMKDMEEYEARVKKERIAHEKKAAELLQKREALKAEEKKKEKKKQTDDAASKEEKKKVDAPKQQNVPAPVPPVTISSGADTGAVLKRFDDHMTYHVGSNKSLSEKIDRLFAGSEKKSETHFATIIKLLSSKEAPPPPPSSSTTGKWAGFTAKEAQPPQPIVTDHERLIETMMETMTKGWQQHLETPKEAKQEKGIIPWQPSNGDKGWITRLNLYWSTVLEYPTPESFESAYLFSPHILLSVAPAPIPTPPSNATEEEEDVYKAAMEIFKQKMDEHTKTADAHTKAVDLIQRKACAILALLHEGYRQSAIQYSETVTDPVVRKQHTEIVKGGILSKWVENWTNELIRRFYNALGRTTATENHTGQLVHVVWPLLARAHSRGPFPSRMLVTAPTQDERVLFMHLCLFNIKEVRIRILQWAHVTPMPPLYVPPKPVEEEKPKEEKKQSKPTASLSALLRSPRLEPVVPEPQPSGSEDEGVSTAATQPNDTSSSNNRGTTDGDDEGDTKMATGSSLDGGLSDEDLHSNISDAQPRD